MPLTSATIMRIRQQYADGVPVAQICAENGIVDATIYYWVDGGPRDPARRLAPIARRRAYQSRTSPKSEARQKLVERLWRTAERQVREIEERLKSVGQKSSEREHDTRSLAVLVKTLRELAAFDEAHPAAQTQTEPIDDDEPRDMDEFRRELARIMDAIIARREG